MPAASVTQGVSGGFSQTAAGNPVFPGQTAAEADLFALQYQQNSGQLPPLIPTGGPSIGAYHGTADDFYMSQLRAAAEEGARADSAKPGRSMPTCLRNTTAPMSTLDRFSTELFRPRNQQPGLGGTSLAEQAVINGLVVGSLVGGAPARRASRSKPTSRGAGRGQRPVRERVGAASYGVGTAANGEADDDGPLWDETHPLIEGSPDPNRTPEHVAAKQAMAELYQASGMYVRVGMGIPLSEFSGLEHTPDIEPDVMGLRPDGTIDMVEIKSPGQSIRFLDRKLQKAANQLPPESRGVTLVINPGLLQMNEQVVITSAAIYFEPKPGQPIPVRMVRTRESFSWSIVCPRFSLRPAAGTFSSTTCHVLADRGGDLPIFGEVATRAALSCCRRYKAAKSGAWAWIRHSGANDRENWRANVAVDPAGGECYVGVEERFAQDASASLRFRVRYGEQMSHALWNCL